MPPPQAADGKNSVALRVPRDLRAQCPQAVGSGFNIPVGIRAAQNGFVLRKGGADQQTVRLGLGGYDLNRP